jgi:S-DNA-T family DNA segregation ATPase FtsK/SpoIIIE
MAYSNDPAPLLPGSLRAKLDGWLLALLGYAMLAACIAGAASLLTWSIADASLTRATDAPVRNLLGPAGAAFADLAMRLLGLAGVFLILPPAFWALQLITRRRLEGWRLKLVLAPLAVLLLAAAASSLPRVAAWPVPFGLGGFLGDRVLRVLSNLTSAAGPGGATVAAGVAALAGGMIVMMASLGLSPGDLKVIWRDRRRARGSLMTWTWRRLGGLFDGDGARTRVRREPTLDMPSPAPGGDRVATWRAGPALNREARLASGYTFDDDPTPSELPPRARDFDGTDRDYRDMARRFAPEHAEAGPAPGVRAARPRPRGTPRSGSASEEEVWPERDVAKPEPKPIWPGSVPVPVTAEALPDGRHRLIRQAGDELYSRAVAIVCAGRKASTDFLQQQLGIGYMRAADLIERMEREGILGAPIRNGTRPILGRRRPRVV